MIQNVNNKALTIEDRLEVISAKLNKLKAQKNELRHKLGIKEAIRINDNPEYENIESQTKELKEERKQLQIELNAMGYVIQRPKKESAPKIDEEIFVKRLIIGFVLFAIIMVLWIVYG